MRITVGLAVLFAACSSASSTGNGADFAPPPDQSIPPDLAAGGDFNTIGLDPPVGHVELGAPDLATPDFAPYADLSPYLDFAPHPDLAPYPDLATPDLSPSPDLLPEQFRDRVFAATSYNASTEPVYEITGGTKTLFATVPAAGWLGPLVITSEGRFFIASNAQGGSVWEITAGGDFTTGAAPFVAGLFTGNISFVDGMAGDTLGHLYVANSEHGAQAMAMIDVATKKVTTFGSYDNAEGVLAVGGTLYVGEGGKGRVIARNLGTGAETPFATGFVTGEDHVSAQLAADFNGHLYTNWKGVGASSTGLYDITAGGDFTGKAPLVAQGFNVDVNQLAFASTGDCYVAGASSGNNYVSRRVGGVLQPFVVFVSGVGDNETMAIGH